MKNSDALYLGLDSSTQGLKAIVIDDDLAVVHEETVNFDADLPQFKTEGGVHRGPDGLSVTSPPLLWVAALDMLLDRMKVSGFDFARVVAISGSGQQHGSVYMKTGARKSLQSLQPGSSLQDQLSNVFSVPGSPVWMDSSTTKQCEEREASMGGPQKVADLTGSRAYERFTGNQIAKVYQTMPEAYEKTERILLVSSFMASLVVGDYACIDASDGSGMNLMNIRTREWVPSALDVSAPGLAEKLGPVVESHSVAGSVHAFYCEKYGFTTDCTVIAFSGDNPNSLAGLQLREAGAIAISLGTSDTVFGSLSDPRPSASEGHIFCNPIDPKGYMALICYKNGSLTREAVRDEATGGTWDGFRDAVGRTPVGNEGRIGFYVKEPEITPPIMQTGTFRYDADDSATDSFPPDADARAVLEAQFLSMRLHGGNVGIEPKSILATGGASVDASVTRVMSDVLGVPVSTGEQPNSASLGAAYRALHGLRCKEKGSFVPFADVITSSQDVNVVAEPNSDAHAVYTAMLDRFAKLEAGLS